MYNVKYGKMEASDEEVIEACKTAGLHEDIQTFKQGKRIKDIT